MSTLRFTPNPADAPTSHTLPGTHPEFSVHDAFRHGLHSVKHEVGAVAHHPLEPVLAQADLLAMQRKLTLQRQVYGLHAPLRVQMERSLLALKHQSPVFKSVNLGLEVMAGKDESIDVEDVLGDRDECVDDVDFHAVMERKLKIKV